jgi:hypothetical protein
MGRRTAGTPRICANPACARPYSAHQRGAGVRDYCSIECSKRALYRHIEEYHKRNPRFATCAVCETGFLYTVRNAVNTRPRTLCGDPACKREHMRRIALTWRRDELGRPRKATAA